jgi:ribosomal protein S27E
MVLFSFANRDDKNVEPVFVQCFFCYLDFLLFGHAQNMIDSQTCLQIAATYEGSKFLESISIEERKMAE